MVDVRFQEGDQFTRRSTIPASANGLTGWLIAHKIVKSSGQALTVQLGIIVIGIAATIFIVFSGHPPKPTAKDLRQDAWMRTGHAGVPPANYTP